MQPQLVIDPFEEVRQPARAELVHLPLLERVDDVVQPEGEPVPQRLLQGTLMEVRMHEDVLVVRQQVDEVADSYQQGEHDEHRRRPHELGEPGPRETGPLLRFRRCLFNGVRG